MGQFTLSNGSLKYTRLLVVLFCLSFLNGYCQNSAVFKPIGEFTWVKKNIIANPERLACKKYVCKVLKEFVPAQKQKIFKQKAHFYKDEVNRQFKAPHELPLRFNSKAIMPLQKIAAPPFLFKDNSRYNISYIDKAHGFISDAVVSLAEDNEHNIWIATSDAGVIKYDGSYYYPYDIRCGLISNSVVNLKFNGSSGLWISTSQGVQILRNDSVFEPLLPDIKNGDLNVYKTNCDSYGNIWVNTRNYGAFKFDIQKQTIGHFDTACGLPFNKIFDVVIDRQNNYWIAGTGLVKIEGNSITHWYSTKHYFNDDYWTALLEDADTIWAGTFDNCIYKITAADTTQFSTRSNFTGRVFDLIKKDGALWFTLYDGGVCYLKGDDYLVFDENNGLGGPMPYNLIQDNYGNIWIGTCIGGFSRLNEMSILTDNTVPKLLRCAASIRKDKEGNQWYFLNGGGIVKESPGGYERISNEPQKPLPSVRHFMDGILNDDGSAWLSSYSYGIARYDKEKITFYYYSDVAENRVALGAVRAQNTPWFATMNYGLIYIRNDTFYHLTSANGLLTNNPIAVDVDPQGALLCISGNGIQKISNDTIYDLYVNNQPFNFSANCLLVTSNSDFLIASDDKGLLLLANHTLYSLAPDKYINYFNISYILEDKTGTLWLTCGQGIIRGKREGLTISNIKLFSSDNGLMFTKMNNAGYIDSLGTPHWSVDNGFIKCKPEFERPASPIPYFRCLNVNINGNKVDMKKVITVLPNHELKLYYSVICWGSENQLIQKYALINIHKNDTSEFSIGEKGIVKLHDLPPGEYKILLVADMGIRKYYHDALHLVVLPYWYNTVWFYAFSVIVLLIVVFILIRFRTKRLQKAQQELEQVVTIRTAELMNSLAERDILLKEIHHRVKNNLQVISGLLELQKEEMTDDKVKAAFAEGQSRVRSVALIHHNLYQHENLASIHFKPFISDLVKYLSEVFEEKNKKISVDVNGNDEQLDIDSAVPLGLIINELLTNAYKYASGANGIAVVKLELKRFSNTEYRLIYSDNGPGIKGTINFDNAASLGLRLIKGLIGQLGGSVVYHYSQGSVFTFVFKTTEARRKDK